MLFLAVLSPLRRMLRAPSGGGKFELYSHAVSERRGGGENWNERVKR